MLPPLLLQICAAKDTAKTIGDDKSHYAACGGCAEGSIERVVGGRVLPAGKGKK